MNEWQKLILDLLSSQEGRTIRLPQSDKGKQRIVNNFLRKGGLSSAEYEKYEHNLLVYGTAMLRVKKNKLEVVDNKDIQLDNDL